MAMIRVSIHVARVWCLRLPRVSKVSRNRRAGAEGRGSMWSDEAMLFTPGRTSIDVVVSLPRVYGVAVDVSRRASNDP